VTIRFAILTFAAMFIFSSEASAVKLPSEDEVNGILKICSIGRSQSIEGDVKGQINLWKRGAEASGRASIDDLGGLLSTLPSGQQLDPDLYKEYTKCIKDSFKEFMSYGPYSPFRRVLGEASSATDLSQEIDAISELRIQISKEDNNVNLEEAAKIISVYIAKNIETRKTRAEDISLRPRDGNKNVFQPRDIIYAIDALSTIRDRSNSRVKIRLVNIDFSKINFSVQGGLDMSNFDFSYSNFDDAFLSGCKCKGANFAFANLTNVAVWNADFTQVNFLKANLSGSKWAGVDFRGSNIEQAQNHSRVILMDGPKGLNSNQRGLFP
jgi:uncharacterized protein YjbI with pentapeptide repeats